MIMIIHDVTPTLGITRRALVHSKCITEPIKNIWPKPIKNTWPARTQPSRTHHEHRSQAIMNTAIMNTAIMNTAIMNTAIMNTSITNSSQRLFEMNQAVDLQHLI
eukprot:TRINITY_DN4708_c0_g1_i2.p1 TRINITY_DN4708_c0_g1~~TRINITY_DN4708_c0_g1_i2.p1  ORF type:complete len:105 (+),score=2.72 TRINITY_DN4708_c0_g1_i2:139-453(+)